MSSNLVVDVLIVGGGPAGCAAAIRAAAHGLKVVLVEQTRFPREAPGEALHPDVDALFEQLGVTTAISNAGFVRFPGWILDHSGDRTFIPFGTRSRLRFGYQAWRSELDSILLTHAQQSAVTVIQSTHAGDVVLAANRVVGLRMAELQCSCRFVIDASGAARWLSRRMDLPVRQLSPSLIARFGYVWEDSDLGIIPEFHEHASGWTWLARVRPDCCQCVTLALDAGESPALPSPFDRLTRLRGADVTWRFVPECAGAGYFLCGDAAATLDPAASSGVARALAAGTKAADLISKVVARRISERDAVQLYREWLNQEVMTQAAQLAARYAALERPPLWLDAV